MLWALTDNQGTVRDVVDSDGVVVNHITYDSFGKVTSESNAAVEFRFGYTGRELDAETGLYYYRARYYNPATGRFLSEDPISFGGGDANLYRYVGNSPTNYTDPTGLFLDTLVDVASITYDVYRLLKDNVFGSCNNLGDNLSSLGLDLLGLGLSFCSWFRFGKKRFRWC